MTTAQATSDAKHEDGLAAARIQVLEYEHVRAVRRRDVAQRNIDRLERLITELREQLRTRVEEAERAA